MSSRIRASEASGNLFGRAALAQVCPDILPQPRIKEFPRSPWVMGSGDRLALRCTGAIGTASEGVPGQLAAHGAGGSAQDRGHQPQRIAAGQPQTHGFTFFGTHVSIGSRVHGNTLARQGLQCCTWS